MNPLALMSDQDAMLLVVTLVLVALAVMSVPRR